MWCESNDVVYFVQKIVIFGRLSFLRERVIERVYKDPAYFEQGI